MLIALLMAADSPGFTIENATPLVSSVVSLGFAVWYSYYTTTTVIPKQQEEHRAAIKDAIASHSASIKEIVEEMRDQRDAFDRWKMAGK